MKTKKLILVTLGLLLCATQGFATQYCHTSISNGSKSILMTCSPTGNTNEFQLLFEGTDIVKITGVNNANVGINDINGQAGGVALKFTVSTDDNGSAKATFTKNGTPAAPYVAYMAFATNDGEVVFNPFPTDMDWTATCSGGGGDTEAPVMTSASVSSTTHNSAVVAVTATDNKGVTAYVVKNGDAEVGTYTPSNNTITITGLSASSTYNYTVYAKDAAGNVSASGINIKITTTAAPVGPVSNYCREELTAKNDANAKILLTCTKVSEGNYRIVIEGSNLSGLGGSYYNPGAVELRTKITSSTSTKIICDIPAASDPSLYTPLYVIMSGEKEFTWPKDITWGTCPSTPVSSVSLDKHQQELDNGGKIVLYTTVLPDGATNKDINWTSSNTSVATVDANGVVTGVANGTAIITATSDADHTKSDQCTVTVVDKKTRDYWGEFTYTDSHSREITVTYRISRNTDNTLEFYMSVDQDISDLVPDINVQITAGGATQEQVHLSYNASSRIGTGISTGTYNDASNYNIEFYLASTNSGLHRENVPYTVGSSSISPCGTCFKVTF